MGDTERHSKTGKGILNKLTSADSKDLRYEVKGVDGSVIWNELNLYDYLSEYADIEGNIIYVCDLSVDDKSFEILTYIEGKEQKRFVVLKFDYVEKKFVSNEKYDISDNDDENSPMIDDIVTPMLRNDKILYAPVDQEICEISRSDKKINRVPGLKDTVLKASEEYGQYESVWWFRPLSYSDGYMLYFVTLLTDKANTDTAVMALVVFSDDGEMMDIMMK
ncbi:MAG: hypothetical protein K6C35_06315 [Eubacterium sp.]|nr:hypothetical protein [Eubacterium sp.]